MIPKVEACLETLGKGVGKIHIIDGRQRHSLLLEIFTSKGVGTEIVKTPHRPRWRAAWQDSEATGTRRDSADGLRLLKTESIDRGATADRGGTSCRSRSLKPLSLARTEESQWPWPKR